MVDGTDDPTGGFWTVASPVPSEEPVVEDDGIGSGQELLPQLHVVPAASKGGVGVGHVGDLHEPVPLAAAAVLLFQGGGGGVVEHDADLVDEVVVDVLGLDLERLPLLGRGKGQLPLDVFQTSLLHHGLQGFKVTATQGVGDHFHGLDSTGLEIGTVETWVKVRLDDGLNEKDATYAVHQVGGEPMGQVRQSRNVFDLVIATAAAAAVVVRVESTSR